MKSPKNIPRGQFGYIVPVLLIAAAAIFILAEWPRTVPTSSIPLTPAEKLVSAMNMTFDDEFDTLSLYRNKAGNVTCSSNDSIGTGTWQTVYYNCSRTTAANAEAQEYIDENFISYFNDVSSPNAHTTSTFPFLIEQYFEASSSAPTSTSTLNSVLNIAVTPSDQPIKDILGPWAQYTSGMLTTEYSFSQTYGYFEMRAQLPAGKGVWPAFWLLPADKSWPPEIDIVESFGDTNPANGEGSRTKIHYASHFSPSNTICGDWHDTGVDITAGFHTYGVDWEPDSLTYYFDGYPYARCPANLDANKPFYMIINIAVGGIGSWPGTPDATNIWPSVMKVDYVRVYQYISEKN